MSDELEFGVVRHAEPRRKRRPDRDAHYATAACGAPASGELRIYVELDTWRELLDHASSDTSVELGGVLLGGFYVDDDGEPFVWITDSLRAEHYEATRGSFKFTHDTWQSITRRKAEYSDETRMTGWYHTHPDWGVFLSSLDLFICEHFFGQPLDLALVLDPCRGDWGFFQWTGEAGQPPRRTGGFFLVASRTRAAEAAEFAARFQSMGETTMPKDSKWTSLAAPTSSSGAPVVHIHAPQPSPWQQLPVWGAILLQTALLAAFAWRGGPSGAGGDRGGDVAAARDLLERRELEARREAQAELMDRVLEDLAQAPEGTFHELTELQAENEALSSTVRGLRAREKELSAEQAALATKADRERRSIQTQLEAAQAREQHLATQVQTQRQRLDDLAAKLRGLGVDDESATSAAPGASSESPSQPSSSGGEWTWRTHPAYLAGGALAAAAVVATGWWLRKRKLGDELDV